MQTPGQLNITIVQGQTFRLPLTLQRKIGENADGTPILQAIDLTGHIGYAQVRKDSKPTAALYATMVIEFPDRLNGRVDLVMSADVTRAVPRPGMWDFATVDAAGVARYWVEGGAALNARVTHIEELAL